MKSEDEPNTPWQVETEESFDEQKKQLLKPIMGPMEISQVEVKDRPPIIRKRILIENQGSRKSDAIKKEINRVKYQTLNLD